MNAKHFMELKKRILKYKKLGLDRPFFVCPGEFMPGRRCQIFSHYIIPHSFCQVKRLFKFFFCQFFSPSSSLCARRPCVKFYALSNFNKPATNQLHQLSNFESATKSATNKNLTYNLFIFIFPLLL